MQQSFDIGVTKREERTGRSGQRLRSGEPAIGVWMQIPHAFVAETLAQTGFDFILMEGEHAPISPDALSALLSPAELHGMPVMYRVRWNTVELIKGALDIGVSALMVPMVNSAQEAAAAKYPPVGRRGIGAMRASNYYLDDNAYLNRANAEIPIVLQIETREALQAVDEIAATPGLDALYIGPGNLAMSLGLTPGVLHPELRKACAKVVEAAGKRKIPVGIDLPSMSFVEPCRDMGFRFMTHGLDALFIVEGGRSVVAQLRKALGK